MRNRSVVILICSVLFAVAIAGCAAEKPADAAKSPAKEAASQAALQSSGETASAAATSGELTLTTDELAKYNGQDGQPAYIAVDGVIYDVTDVPQWKDGQHNGFSAGQDLTDAIKNKSPHGIAKLSGIPVVGKLAE